MHFEPSSIEFSDAMRLQYKSSIAKAKSMAEIKHIFSRTATSVVEQILNGGPRISEDTIQLIAENGGAIFIGETLSENSTFRHACLNTACIPILKKLAEIALNGQESE